MSTSPDLQAQLANNPRRITLFSFFAGGLVIFPVVVPFFQSKGLSMQDIFVLESIFAAGVVVLEVPSGYIADLWGRRRALIIGSAAWLFAGLLLLVAEGFWTLVVFEMSCAIAISLLSGSNVALLYDSLLAIGADESEKTKAIGQMAAARSMSQAVASIGASVLVLFSFEHVLWGQAVYGSIPLLIAFFLVEAPHAAEAQSHTHNLRRVAREIRMSPDTQAVLIALTLLGTSTFYVVWIYQDYWARGGIDLAWFGYLFAAYNISMAIVSRQASSWLRRLGYRGVLFFMCFAPSVTYLVMGTVTPWLQASWPSAIWLGVMIGFFTQLSRGLQVVVLTNQLNSVIASDFRATVNSLASFSWRAIFIVTGPLVGWGIDTFGNHAVLTALGITFIAANGWVWMAYSGRLDDLHRTKAPDLPSHTVQKLAR